MQKVILWLLGLSVRTCVDSDYSKIRERLELEDMHRDLALQ